VGTTLQKKYLWLQHYDECLKHTNFIYNLFMNEHDFEQILSLIHVFLCSFEKIGLKRQIGEKGTKNRSLSSFARGFSQNKDCSRTCGLFYGRVPTSTMLKSLN